MTTMETATTTVIVDGSAQEPRLQRPETFNFAIDVIDRWASQADDLKAMYWVSQDESIVQTMTFKYFSRRSQQISVLFEQLGVKEGDTLIMILPRVPAWWEVALAAMRSGIIFSPAPTLCTEKDIRYRCNQSKATVFVGDVVSVRKFLAVQSDCQHVQTVIQVGDAPSGKAVSFYSALEAINPNSTTTAVRRHWSAPALIYFTSGTSGSPKMVRHNQVSYPFALRSTAKHWYQLAPGKIIWNTAEQGWAKAAWSFFGAWSSGATIFVHDDRGAFNPRRLLGILHRYPITTMCAPPLAYRQLVLDEAQDYLKQHPPIALTHCTAAGEALNAEVSRKWHKITGIAIHEGYGQTETVLLCGHFAGSQVRPGSMGKPAPGVPLHVINSEGEEVADGIEGDIAVQLDDDNQGRSFFGLFDGYVADDNTFTRREKVFNLGGKIQSWYLTGDRAKRDSEGYFWFVGRADDVINSSGYRIGPFEVESTLKLHPAVAECAVTSSPDPKRGEVVKAFVVLTPGYQMKSHEKLKPELQSFCKENAAPYKYPRKIDFVTHEVLPKTTSGKIQRSKLREREWSQGIKGKL